MKKKISVVIPTYNEELNVNNVYNEVKEELYKNSNYDYEILFIDNYSTDKTRLLISALCEKDKNVKAIFNAKNFGFIRSTFYGLTQGTGDCVVLIFADLQDPPRLISQFIVKWEQEFKIVIGIKNKSEENKLMYLIRGLYYKLIKSISEIDHINQFTGFGLYDRSFINVLRNLDDPLPYLRGIVSELGYERTEIYYQQNKRTHGKTSFNFLRLYDVAMLGITSYSKSIMRLSTIGGFFLSFISLMVGIITFILKLLNWESFPLGTAAIIVGIFILGSLQLFFIGFLGEYIMNINIRLLKRPLVIEEKRINFDD